MTRRGNSVYEFGPFRLDLAEKALTKDGKFVALTPKAFDTLLILIEKGGRLVEKEELMKQLWPDTFVEENSLSQNIYLVRKALGEESQGARYIETVPRRGYRFTAPVRQVSAGDTTIGTHILVAENDVRAEPRVTASPLVAPLSPPPRISRTLFLALTPALTLLAIWLVWIAPRGSVAGFKEKSIAVLPFKSLGPSAMDGSDAQLTTDERKHLTRRSTENSEAYQAYARGLFFWNKRTEDGLSRSIGYFNEAIAKDPRYALAWAGLADAYAVTGYLRYKFMPANDAYRKAEEAATRALEIDRTMAEAYTALSVVRAYRDSDLPGAEKEIKKAVALKENSATAHQRYSIYLRDQGRLSEALIEIQRAHELDPLSLTIGSNLAYIHYLRRDYDQAANCAQRVLETEPDYFQSLIALGPTLQQQRKYQEAIALLEKVRDQQKGKAGVYYNALEALGHAYAVAGKRAAAERIIAELKACPEDRDDTTYRQALIRAGLGQLDKAFALLEANSYSWTLPPVGLTLDPRFDNLRADPRYEALMRKRFSQLPLGIGR
jgi:DNA-binding winged helix-turn-helix (wHTH) protein/Flp pilus assembly protein TadD